MKRLILSGMLMLNALAGAPRAASAGPASSNEAPGSALRGGGQEDNGPMDQDALEDFFAHQKKGAPIYVTLRNGQEIKGIFSSYDDYYQTVWIVPKREAGGSSSTRALRLSGLISASIWKAEAKKEKQEKEPLRKELEQRDYQLLKDINE